MDLLIEKLDGSRYYLSQYKVLITDFEESAPSVARNNKQLDQRNGNIDFGGWHTDKTIDITGYYRADDIDDEEMLREKLYALLSDPDGYYIIQLKTTPSVAMERPGETSGNYYDRLRDYPSHKRFLVYTEAPEMELVGNVNGTLLYKLTAEFKTMKLPYGETPAIDVAIDSPYKDVPVNLLTGTSNQVVQANNWNMQIADIKYDKGLGGALCASVMINNADHASELAKGSARIILEAHDKSGNILAAVDGTYIGYNANGLSWCSISINDNTADVKAYIWTDNMNANTYYSCLKIEKGTTASPWSPNPADPEYNSWYYSLAGNVSVPYSGSVPCNQLEQGFTVKFTATGSASSLSFKIDDTELTSSNTVAAGDVFLLNGFSYIQNGLSIVSKTNKAYFILQPDKPNRITCNVPGKVRILGFQNLYA
jgi:hypothetical protein